MKFFKILSKITCVAQLLLCKFLSGKKSIAYVDIGASSFTKPLFAFCFDKFRIIAFEPDPRSEDIIKNNALSKFYPYALSSENSNQVIYLTHKSHCSSLKRPMPSEDLRYTIERQVSVDCRRMDQFEDSVDVLKIDAQGSELDILVGAGDKLESIKYVELEAWFIRKYEKQARIDELIEFMHLRNFAFLGFKRLYPDHPEKHVGLGFADLVFINRELNKNDFKTVFCSLVDAGLESKVKDFAHKINLSVSQRLIVRLVLILSVIRI